MTREGVAASGREYVIEILVFVSAPDAKAADRMAADAKKAVERTNYRIRDGKVQSVTVTDIRGDDDGE